MDAAKSFRLKMFKSLLDIIALKYIKDNGSLAGYGFMNWIHEKYNIVLSSGSVYTKIYKLERRGLVKGEWAERKRTYTLTKKGKANLNAILSDPTAEQFLTLLDKPLNKEEMESAE